MSIHPDRLRILRKRKPLTRAQLARKSGVSVRHIARLESKTSSSTKEREQTIKDLSEALGVEPGVLTGELPLPDATPSSPSGERERIQISALMMPEVRLAYGLLKRRYDINATTIINMAPLFLVLLAEGSLVWRREELTKVREATDQLCGLARGHLSFAKAASRAAAEEEKSIEKRDLFGEDVAEGAFVFGYDRSENNPFADYLCELARKIDNKDAVEVNDIEFIGPTKDFPQYEVCNGDLEKIAGGDDEAKFALRNGHARISDIPDDLWAEDATDARVKWLEEKLPESEKRLWDMTRKAGL